MEYLDGCSTAIRRVARKVATIEDGLVSFLEMTSPWECNFWTGGLAYDIHPVVNVS